MHQKIEELIALFYVPAIAARSGDQGWQREKGMPSAALQIAATPAVAADRPAAVFAARVAVAVVAVPARNSLHRFPPPLLASQPSSSESPSHPSRMKNLFHFVFSSDFYFLYFSLDASAHHLVRSISVRGGLWSQLSLLPQVVVQTALLLRRSCWQKTRRRLARAHP